MTRPDDADRSDGPSASARAAAGESVAAAVQRLGDEDPQAFETLFHRYYEALYNFAHFYVRSRAVAEELVQDVFCRLWARRGTLPSAVRLGATGDEPGHAVLRTYLYRAVRNAAVSWLRHQRLERQLSRHAVELTPPGMGAGPPPPDAAVGAAELQARLRRAVAALPERHRRVLLLRWDHQLSYPEIAAVLQLPLKTVESRVTRAFRALRQALEDFQ